MHCADVIQHVLVANGDAKTRDQEVESKLHLEKSEEREVFPNPEKGKVT